MLDCNITRIQRRRMLMLVLTILTIPFLSVPPGVEMHHHDDQKESGRKRESLPMERKGKKEKMLLLMMARQGISPVVMGTTLLFSLEV